MRYLQYLCYLQEVVIPRGVMRFRNNKEVKTCVVGSMIQMIVLVDLCEKNFMSKVPGLRSLKLSPPRSSVIKILPRPLVSRNLR